jgi:hypothetical protein
VILKNPARTSTGSSQKALVGPTIPTCDGNL